MLHQVRQGIKPLSSTNVVFQFLSRQKDGAYYLLVKPVFSPHAHGHLGTIYTHQGMETTQPN
jgi:hypothetical protein